MSEKTKAARELRGKIKTMLAAGEPIPSRLMRIARGQGSLKGVTPQFMACAHDHFFELPNGILRMPEASEVHDLWRPVLRLETCWSLISEECCQVYVKFMAAKAICATIEHSTPENTQCD